ncbi:MAG TPA: hypothetical protein VFQ45_17115, partial [Longimicrobium sp.]|nr:hypothetical protein [Longimicrobium sp.]
PPPQELHSMTETITARVPRVFGRVLALAGLALAALVGAPADAAAQPERMGQMFNDPALASYRLTTENLNKFVQVVQALEGLEDEDIDLDEHFEDQDPENISIAKIAEAFDGEPRIKSAINGAGMSSREFVTFMFAMMQAMFASLAVQLGGEQALDEMKDGVLKDNVRFFIANQEIFERLGDHGEDEEDDEN